ncbi:MAG: PLP-dependent aspartate aminotransferase family protein [Eubacteriales bacterium]|nr:PLP-dependent aspartate aminotransferase family protein [Eubacteriales bacterium]
MNRKNRYAESSSLFESDEFIEEHVGEDRERYLNSMAPPVFMTSLHALDCIEDYYDVPAGTYLYGRYGNPTVEICEKKIAGLEHGKRAFLYASGMAAATSAVLAVCSAGSHVICVHNAYGPLQSFLNDYCAKDLGMEVTMVHGYDFEEIRSAVKANTSLIVLESPGTATFSLVDLAAVSELAKKNGIVTYIDNSYCSPIFQKPLDQGIDIVMHSCTKYLGGHSDILGGVLVVKDENLIARLSSMRPWLGGIIGPMEAWLMIRGIRTLSVRMKRHAEVAMQVAEALEKNPKVKKVYYPGLKSHPQYELAERQQTGSSGLMSIELNATPDQAKKFVNALKVFKIGPSWGGYESLVVMPLYGNTEEYCAWYGASRGLIRLHCGLEGAELLLEDIQQALDQI